MVEYLPKILAFHPGGQSTVNLHGVAKGEARLTGATIQISIEIELAQCLQKSMITLLHP